MIVELMTEQISEESEQLEIWINKSMNNHKIVSGEYELFWQLEKSDWTYEWINN